MHAAAISIWTIFLSAISLACECLSAISFACECLEYECFAFFWFLRFHQYECFAFVWFAFFFERARLRLQHSCCLICACFFLSTCFFAWPEMPPFVFAWPEMSPLFFAWPEMQPFFLSWPEMQPFFLPWACAFFDLHEYAENYVAASTHLVRLGNSTVFLRQCSPWACICCHLASKWIPRRVRAWHYP